MVNKCLFYGEAYTTDLKFGKNMTKIREVIYLFIYFLNRRNDKLLPFLFELLIKQLYQTRKYI